MYINIYIYAYVYVFGRHEDESPPAVWNIYTCRHICGYIHIYMDIFTHIDIPIRISWTTTGERKKSSA